MTITLAPRPVGTSYDTGAQDWAHRINPMDLVVVEMKADLSDPWTAVMVGFVDQVRENFIGGEKPQRVITILASDFGKVLTRCNADFFAAVDNIQEKQRFIRTNGVTNLYQEPDVNSPIVGTLAPGMEHEVVTQVGNFYYIAAQRYGYGYVRAEDVTFFKKDTASSAKAAELAKLMQQLSGSLSAGGFTIQGLLWEIFFNGSPQDPALCQATIFTEWVYKVFNVAATVYGPNGPQQADLPSLLRFIISKPPEIGSVEWFAGAGSPYMGSIWTLLQSMACLPLGEIFVDTRDDIMHPLVPWERVAYSSQMFDQQVGTAIQGGLTFGEKKDAKVVYVFRQVPFDDADWQNLVMHRINYNMIREYDLGKSDSEVINCYWVTSLIPLDTQQQLISAIPAYLDGQSAVKYGLQSLRVSLNATLVDAQVASSVALKLYDWFKLNPQFREGTITFKGLPSVRIGQRLYIEDTGESFYITSVRHDWRNYEEYVTSVTVTRGLVRGD
ncbi:MAG: SH3 domain-containing protein [Moorellaceae bacterium]